MHGTRGWSPRSQTGSRVWFFRGSSRTQRIIQRSEWCVLCDVCFSLNVYRVLLATIRFLATRPCPRCFILKGRIPDMGTFNDGRRRAYERKDDENRRSTIELIRRLIYGKGRSIGGAPVESSLKPWSWTPTTVGYLFSAAYKLIRYLIVLERVFRSARGFRFRLPPDACA